MKNYICAWLSITALVFFYSPIPAHAQGTLTFTSKTYHFSFDHSDKYLNSTETASKYQQQKCPSGNAATCAQQDAAEVQAAVEHDCNSGFFSDLYSSVAECIQKESKDLTDMLNEIKGKYSQELSKPTDPEGSDKFSTQDTAAPSAYLDYFKYFAKKQGEPLWNGFESGDDAVHYKTVMHGTYTDANGNSSPTIGYNESYFNPDITYWQQNGGIVRIADISRDFSSLNQEDQQLNASLPLKTITKVPLYAKNKYGVSFYRINKGSSGSYQNLYCAVGSTSVCFDISSNLYAGSTTDPEYTTLVAHEKTIMDPIVASFHFGAGTASAAAPVATAQPAPTATIAPAATTAPEPVVAPMPHSDEPQALPPIAPSATTAPAPKQTFMVKVVNFIKHLFD